MELLRLTPFDGWTLEEAPWFCRPEHNHFFTVAAR
jgi:hypothetical protein